MTRSTWMAVLATVAVLAAAGFFSRLASLPGAGFDRAALASRAAALAASADGWARAAWRSARDAAPATSADAWARTAWRNARDAAPGVLDAADRALQRVPIEAAIAAVGVGLATLAVLGWRARDPRRAALAALRRGLPPARVARQTRIPRDALRTLARRARQ